MGYFENREERAKKAKIHTVEQAKKYQREIVDSVSKSVIYGYPDKFPVLDGNGDTPKMIISDLDSVSAAFKYKNGKTAILNYASYKNPGGMFYNGSSAQEESLCHESYLYNVLKEFEDSYYAWNRNNLNGSLYTDRAIYTPNVYFRDNIPFDVLTCAAPNIGAALKYGRASKGENYGKLVQRIQFIREILEENHVDTFITGAWGCGVFKQDPKEVAHVFKSVFIKSTVDTLVFAVPGGKNLEVFREVIE